MKLAIIAVGTVVVFLAQLALLAGAIYVVVHFAVKFW